MGVIMGIHEYHEGESKLYFLPKDTKIDLKAGNKDLPKEYDRYAVTIYGRKGKMIPGHIAMPAKDSKGNVILIDKAEYFRLIDRIKNTETTVTSKNNLLSNVKVQKPFAKQTVDKMQTAIRFLNENFKKLKISVKGIDFHHVLERITDKAEYTAVLKKITMLFRKFNAKAETYKTHLEHLDYNKILDQMRESLEKQLEKIKHIKTSEEERLDKIKETYKSLGPARHENIIETTKALLKTPDGKVPQLRNLRAMQQNKVDTDRDEDLIFNRMPTASESTEPTAKSLKKDAFDELGDITSEDEYNKMKQAVQEEPPSENHSQES